MDVDIRNAPRWQRGYLDRWSNDQPMPHRPSLSGSSDPCEVLAAWFRGVAGQVANLPKIVTDVAYNNPEQCPAEPAAVLIGCPPPKLPMGEAKSGTSGCG